MSNPSEIYSLQKIKANYNTSQKIKSIHSKRCLESHPHFSLVELSSLNMRLFFNWRSNDIWWKKKIQEATEIWILMCFPVEETHFKFNFNIIIFPEKNINIISHFWLIVEQLFMPSTDKKNLMGPTIPYKSLSDIWVQLWLYDKVFFEMMQ